MKLTVNISPCPNDTFIFYALLHGRVETDGVEFSADFADIERLNSLAISGKADIIKVSYAVLPQIAGDYKILESGGAVGRGNGPLLVARTTDIDLADSTMRIAVPGLHTTANLLIDRMYPHLTDRTPMLFSEIADAVADERFDAGVLIHEGRFTYAERGLQLVVDLGNEWERRTALPLPLGAIAVSQRLPAAVQRAIGRMVAESARYALAHPEEPLEFVQRHAREMSPRVIENHISLFVNELSVYIGDEGRRAVTALTGIGDDIFVK
ncbi:MAG: 1,4-dihydroxy-6-naphthoate synthase [Rikenellaceae bacterium]|nr:1,4-dihydroxy-6-naphthoate synthase [Rikenellaceae bacterium]MCL2692424.1 1,4-dihydroxy-6-naphthoate synthase [Rikenellaceae bacterium]